MAFRFKSFRANTLGLFVLLASITAPAADKDKPKFEARPAAEYPHRMASEGVTIAAQPVMTDEEAAPAFGKLNPWRYGVLPVLIVVQNDGKESLRLDQLKIEYVLPDRSRVDDTPARDVPYIHGARTPKAPIGGPGGGIAMNRKPKNPLAAWEIEGRAFAAKMLPPGQSASGFFYFQVQQSSAAASIYITGLATAPGNKELYYFEIPMS